MTKEEKANQVFWDEVAPVHYKAYDLEKLRKGEWHFDEIQKRELPNLKGKSVLHLMCHIGADSLSMVTEGAKVTGIDISEQSLKWARQLSIETGLEAKFIQSNIYDLKDNLDEQFDVVYTSQGVIIWLKDIDEWGKIVAHYLKPGGTFYIMDTHPIVMGSEYDNNKCFKVSYDYFGRKKALHWDEEWPDYADENYIPKNSSYEWNWPLSDIVNALIKAGLQINFLNEYPQLFYKGYPGMQKAKDGWWYLPELEEQFPLIFTIGATKPK